MKRLFLFSLIVMGFATGTYAQNTSTTPAKPKTNTTTSKKTATASSKTKNTVGAAAAQGVQMKFETEMIDLGKVKKGEKRSFKYHFVNTGTETIDFDIVSGCDCTKTDWPRSPVKPGQKGVIDVTFDSTEKEKSETVDVDIYLMNKDPKTNRSIFRRVKYKFELIN